MAAVGRTVPPPRRLETSDTSTQGSPQGGRAMRAAGSLDEAESLARLGEHERELDQKLELARQEAKGILAQARQEADRLKERAEAELAEEVERLREERSRGLEQALTAIRRQGAQRSEAVQRQAESNRERVLAWLLARVAGRDTP